MPGSSAPNPLRTLRTLPLWSRWLLTIVVYAAVILAIVLAVHSLNASSSRASRSEINAEAQANREGQIAIREDEAPHTAVPGAGVDARVALERAIATDVRARIAHGQLTGPLQSVRCRQGGAARAGRRPFRCTVASANIAYPFVAVADERTRALTWCKVDPPPSSGAPLEVPVSPRCRV